MLQPARRKYRKEQKGRNTGVATRGATVAFGDPRIQQCRHAVQPGRELQFGQVETEHGQRLGGRQAVAREGVDEGAHDEHILGADTLVVN